MVHVTDMIKTPTVAPAARNETAASMLHARVSHIMTGGDKRAMSQRNALIVFAIRCTSAFLLYVSQIAMARWMGAADYGVYVFLWTCVLVGGALAHMGLGLGIIRLIPLHRVAHAYDELRGLVRSARAFALASASVLAIIAAALLWAFQSHVSSAYLIPALLMLACLPGYALTDVQDGIGRGHGWMAAALLPPYVLRPLLLLMAMAIAHLLHFPMIATTAIAAAIIATWLTGIVQALWIDREMRASYGPGGYRYLPKAWVQACWPLFAASLSEIVIQNADVIVLSHTVAPADVAVYFAAGKTMSLILFVHYAVGSAMAQRFATYKANGDLTGLSLCIREAVTWTFWPSLATAVAILALGRPLLALFGPQFEAGYPVMAILVAGLLTRAAMGPAEILLNMMGEQRAAAFVVTTAAVLSVGLNVILVPLYGLTGAATATATALAFAALANGAVAFWKLDLRVAIWDNVGVSKREAPPQL